MALVTRGQMHVTQRLPKDKKPRKSKPPSRPPLLPQRVIRSRSQSMDAMGLSNKKPNTVSTSHSGSFTPNNPDLAKAAGIVSVPRLPRTHPPPQGPWCSLPPEAWPYLFPLPHCSCAHPGHRTCCRCRSSWPSAPARALGHTIPQPPGLLLLALCLFGCDFLQPLCPCPY